MNATSDPVGTRVLLVGNYPADAQESMLRFARMMLAGLSARGVAVEFMAPAVVFGRWLPVARGLGKWLGYVDKFVLFPWVLRRRVRGLGPGWIVQICDHSNAMYQAAAGSADHPVLVVCHDLGAVRGALGEATDVPASRAGRVLQRWIARSLGRADLIACDSTATKLDVERLIRRPDGVVPRTELAFIGLNVPYRRLDLLETRSRLRAAAFDAEMPFVLNVGSSLPRKNRAGVVRIFARLKAAWPPGRLVFAGEALPAEIWQLARDLDVADRVIEMVKPSDALLEALYNAAHALLFPSRFEGFGWPAIEAQACGCPVLCSDAGSLREVVGDSGFVRPPDDEEAFAAEVRRLVGDEAARAFWSDAGFRNVTRFGTDTMIDRYLELYQSLVAGKLPPVPAR